MSTKFLDSTLVGKLAEWVSDKVSDSSNTFKEYTKAEVQTFWDEGMLHDLYGYSHYKNESFSFYVNGEKQTVTSDDDYKWTWDMPETITEVTSLKGMFKNNKDVSTIHFENFDTSSVTDMSEMFYGCYNSGFRNAPAIYGIQDTSNVTDMSYMFYGCEAMTVCELGNFDTSKVTNMSHMFYNCKYLYNLDFSGFDFSNVTDMSYMFYGMSVATKFDTLDLSTTGNVTDMSYTFAYSNLANIDYSKLDTSNVTNMTYMFYTLTTRGSINLSNFNTSKVTDMSFMFGQTRFYNLDCSSFDTSNVTTMQGMFAGCSEGPTRTINVKSFNTSNVTNMSFMFSNCTSLTELDLSNFDTSKVTNIASMFKACSSLTALDLSNFITTQISGSDNYSNFVTTSMSIDYKASQWNSEIPEAITKATWNNVEE